MITDYWHEGGPTCQSQEIDHGSGSDHTVDKCPALHFFSFQIPTLINKTLPH